MWIELSLCSQANRAQYVIWDNAYAAEQAAVTENPVCYVLLACSCVNSQLTVLPAALRTSIYLMALQHALKDFSAKP